MKIHQILLIFGLICEIFSENSIEIGPQIVGGQVAALGQFPHHVLIAKRRLQFTDFCSGSLIRFNWILTSATCVSNFYELDLSFGIVSRNATATWRTTIIDPTHVRIHENYNPQSLINDIALIFVQNAQPNLISSAYIGIVNPHESVINLTGNMATVSGFGWISQVAGSGSNELRFIEVQIVSDAVCQAAVGGAFNETAICTNTTGGVGTCREDAGSGLISTINSVTSLIGVTTFDDCNLTQPSIFTRVSSFIPWINRIIAEIGTTTSTSTTSTTSTTAPSSSTPSRGGKFALNWSLIIFLLLCASINFLLKN